MKEARKDLAKQTSKICASVAKSVARGHLRFSDSESLVVVDQSKVSLLHAKVTRRANRRINDAKKIIKAKIAEAEALKRKSLEIVRPGQTEKVIKESIKLSLKVFDENVKKTGLALEETKERLIGLITNIVHRLIGENILRQQSYLSRLRSEKKTNSIELSSDLKGYRKLGWLSSSQAIFDHLTRLTQSTGELLRPLHARYPKIMERLKLSLKQV